MRVAFPHGLSPKGGRELAGAEVCPQFWMQFNLGVHLFADAGNGDLVNPLIETGRGGEELHKLIEDDASRPCHLPHMPDTIFETIE